MRSRNTRLKTLLLLGALVLLLRLLSRGAPSVHAAIDAYDVIRVQPLGAEYQVTLLVTSDTALRVTTTAASQLRVFPATDHDGHVRTTVTAMLDRCQGRLTVASGDDTRTWRQYCQLLPLVQQAVPPGPQAP